MYSHNGSLRLRQHGTVLSFSQKIYTLCNIFVKKKGIFRPAEAKYASGFGTA